MSYTRNPILKSDSYKWSHYLQYPPQTRFISSYIEARGNNGEVMPEDAKVIFNGLQAFIKDLRVPNFGEVRRASEIAAAHGVPFNLDGWNEIAMLGYYPVRIQAMPEGLGAAPGNVQVQIINTDPKFFWLTSFLETAILRAVWYPTTVASLSAAIKVLVLDYLHMTSDTHDTTFMLHDFGARGVSSSESAEIGATAHLINFMGSDTIEAADYIGHYYGFDSFPFFSIPAAEHSTITAWGRDNEATAYRNMVEQFGGEGKIYAVVSDSYDIYNAVENIWGNELKDLVISKGGRLVIRPDSGIPFVVVPKILEILGNKFGFTKNSLGYKVLPSSVRVIQGDGVNYDSIHQILFVMKSNGWSAENITFGMGGALLQKLDRDTLKYAMKASAITVNGEVRDVYKDPVTDAGKRSKRGRLALTKIDGNFVTVRESELVGANWLRDVYVDGVISNTYNWEQVKAHAAGSFKPWP